MRALIATVHVPFVRGGAEILAEDLHTALVEHGCEADILSLPFVDHPPDRIGRQLLASRLLDFSHSAGAPIDLVIGMKFPAYLVPHPRKVIWLMHQHRQAYDLWERNEGELFRWPDGSRIREAIWRADRILGREARSIFTISQNVSARLARYNGVESRPLYPPPRNAHHYHCDKADDYLFFPSRVSPLKRQRLVLEALARTRNPVRIVFAGRGDDCGAVNRFRALADQLGVAQRTEWLEHVEFDRLVELYARSRGVVFPPFDEDYGYVTLEAMLSGKPVITCEDSGGPLEFVVPGVTGLVCSPRPGALAAAFDRLWSSPQSAAAMGAAGRERYDSLDLSWPRIVDQLLR